MVTVSYFVCYNKNLAPIGADAEKYFTNFEKNGNKSTATRVQEISTTGSPVVLRKARSQVQQDTTLTKQENQKKGSSSKHIQFEETKMMKDDNKEVIALALDLVENNNRLPSVNGDKNKPKEEMQSSITSAADDDTDEKEPIILNNTNPIKYTTVFKKDKPTAFPVIKLTEHQKKSLVSRNLSILQAEGYQKLEAPRRRGRPVVYTQVYKDILCYYVNSKKLSPKEAASEAGYRNMTSAYNHLREYREYVRAGMDELCESFKNV